MFDEERRSRLLAAYRALPDLERRLCRFLAVLYVPPSSRMSVIGEYKLSFSFFKVPTSDFRRHTFMGLLFLYISTFAMHIDH